MIIKCCAAAPSPRGEGCREAAGCVALSNIDNPWCVAPSDQLIPWCVALSNIDNPWCVAPSDQLILWRVALSDQCHTLFFRRPFGISFCLVSRRGSAALHPSLCSVALSGLWRQSRLCPSFVQYFAARCVTLSVGCKVRPYCLVSRRIKLTV